jgi:hypothetical protein
MMARHHQVQARKVQWKPQDMVPYERITMSVIVLGASSNERASCPRSATWCCSRPTHNVPVALQGASNWQVRLSPFRKAPIQKGQSVCNAAIWNDVANVVR